jgi:hypothetical protein
VNGRGSCWATSVHGFGLPHIFRLLDEINRLCSDVHFASLGLTGSADFLPGGRRYVPQARKVSVIVCIDNEPHCTLLTGTYLMVMGVTHLTTTALLRVSADACFSELRNSKPRLD